MKTILSTLKALTAATAILATAPLAAAPADVVPTDPKAGPESLAAGPDGTLYLGSISSLVVSRARPGETIAKPFIDLSADKGAFLLGVLADGPTNTLWVCEMMSMDRGSPLLKGKGVLRSFDLNSGAHKLNLPLPEATNICNDFVVGPDKALYVTDTSNGKVLRLKPGARSFETVIQNAALYGIDGITFLNGQMYVNTVWSNALFRIPLDASGKAGNPVQILTDRLLKSPDGMRAANGRMYVAENAGGQVDEIRINGDKATIIPLKTGLNAPTAVEVHGDTLWVGDRGAVKAVAVPLKK
jgi:sugar lactone lactonase YvrE